MALSLHFCSPNSVDTLGVRIGKGEGWVTDRGCSHPSLANSLPVTAHLCLSTFFEVHFDCALVVVRCTFSDLVVRASKPQMSALTCVPLCVCSLLRVCVFSYVWISPKCSYACSHVLACVWRLTRAFMYAICALICVFRYVTYVCSSYLGSHSI